MSDKITWTNERRRLSDLIPWPRNPRQIKTDQAKRLVQSFDEFGQVEPIAVGPGNEVYNGHQRLNVLAAKHGKNYEVEVRVASRELTEKEREKLTVFLHKGAAGEWNFDTLANEFELDELLEWGFDKKELDLDLWAGDAPDDPGAQIDKAEELREKWGVETGQLWKLGEHRLICGDCTDRAVVERVMAGEKADMVFTDPPYGVSFQGKGGDSIAGDTTYALIPIFFAICSDFVMADKSWIYVCGGTTNADLYSKLFDYYFHSQVKIVVWDKKAMTMRHNGYHSGYELIYFGFTKGAGDWWFGSRAGEAAVDIWHIEKPTNKDRTHLTEKPVELPFRAIGNSCPLGGIVFEPFLGSGSTLIASENIGRKCRAVEISPAYCAVAIQRWVDMTGGEPELVEPVIQDEQDGG